MSNYKLFDIVKFTLNGVMYVGQVIRIQENNLVVKLPQSDTEWKVPYSSNPIILKKSYDSRGA